MTTIAIPEADYGWPRVSPDRRRAVMRAPVRGNPPDIGTPAVALSLPATLGGIDVAADGRFLLVTQKDETAARDALHVLLNWAHTLR